MRGGQWKTHQRLLVEASDSGVIKVSEMGGLGVSTSTVAARCRPGGPWSHLLPGVVQLTNGHPTARQRTVAALMYAGNGAMLSGRSALREYGFGHYAGDVHVLLPDRRRVQSVAFVHVERTTRLPEPEVRSGLPCAPLRRALLDAARRCTSLDAARALIAEIVQRGEVTPDELAAELSAGSKRGSALPRRVIEEVTAHVHSVPEAEARNLWLKSGLPPMVFNRTVVTGDGDFIAVPDGWMDDVGLAWEIDSIEWHLSPAEHAATLERRTRMQGKGIVVLATRPSQVRDDPSAVIDALRAHYAVALARPRPSVRLLPATGE
ncbi:hypothetical protein [Rhodococcus kronopolitis]|uniref:Transcriptional regulator, AbiEi antitoxin, Type IV TA system n=1 Tax=Rhodococcus kronopolitis TaxID=1460226 RepID=A0ABV9FTT6_9NOCA